MTEPTTLTAEEIASLAADYNTVVFTRVVLNGREWAADTVRLCIRDRSFRDKRFTNQNIITHELPDRLARSLQESGIKPVVDSTFQGCRTISIELNDSSREWLVRQGITREVDLESFDKLLTAMKADEAEVFQNLRKQEAQAKEAAEAEKTGATAKAPQKRSNWLENLFGGSSKANNGRA